MCFSRLLPLYTSPTVRTMIGAQWQANTFSSWQSEQASYTWSFIIYTLIYLIIYGLCVYNIGEKVFKISQYNYDRGTVAKWANNQTDIIIFPILENIAYFDMRIWLSWYNDPSWQGRQTMKIEHMPGHTNWYDDDMMISWWRGRNLDNTIHIQKIYCLYYGLKHYTVWQMYNRNMKMKSAKNFFKVFQDLIPSLHLNRSNFSSHCIFKERRL